ncbi:DNA-binding response regulator [Cohnella candidum]|nr:DNA-binding response regulator [Cohnella candidum]
MGTQFKMAHQQWIAKHVNARRGEARRRLIDGHAHAEQAMAEKVWWPAFGHFDHLHPEYEVVDFFGGKRYVDFAYIRGGLYIAIEVDPFGTHYGRLDRRQYSNQWVRQMHLFNDGWLFIRISYDDILERPRLWQQLLQQMVGRLFGDPGLRYDLSASERDILRLASRLDRPIKLADVRTLLDCAYDSARKPITSLVDKKWLIPVGKGTSRVHAWRLDEARKLPPM